MSGKSQSLQCRLPGGMSEQAHPHADMVQWYTVVGIHSQVTCQAKALESDRISKITEVAKARAA